MKVSRHTVKDHSTLWFINVQGNLLRSPLNSERKEKSTHCLVQKKVAYFAVVVKHFGNTL